MRNILWKISVLIIVVFLIRSPAFAQGLKGYLDVTKNITKQSEDGERMLTSETFNRNLYLSLSEPITPVLSYQLNLRTNFSDARSTDDMDETETAYNRSLEPALDLILGNPMYNLSAGFRRRERWNAAHMNDDNRRTNEYNYSRLSLAPEALPSLTIQYDRQKNYDYLSPKTIDDNNTVYSVNSAYELPSQDLRFRYSLNYSYDVSNAPLILTNKTITTDFNSTYNIGYSGRYWQNKADYSIGYQGNYSRNKTERFITQTGTVLNERTPLAGLYVSDVTPDDGPLNTENDLIDNDYSAPITAINIGTSKDHNIGIWISSENSVDRLYIYVDKDVSGDVNLRSISNWNVYKSNSNIGTTKWNKISINHITVFVDTLNNIYRYEIEFSTPQNASYFKAVNLATVSAAGLTDVYVTEIEALGTDLEEEEREIDVSTYFAQQLNFTTGMKPFRKLNFAFNYSIDRTDQNPVSIGNSLGGIVENMFGDSLPDEAGSFKSNITRSYSARSTWLTHRFLTTTFRIQRSESFDNKEETDAESNTYNLSFITEPLPTLNANLSLIRSDSFIFSEKNSTNNSALLSIGSRLYRDVNMITDITYTRSYSFVSETSTSTRQLNGTIDALLTPRLSGTFNYLFNWTSSDGTSSRSKEASAFITYRPGKFINISGNLKVSDSSGDTSTAEGIFFDWLPLRAVRLNANYQHSDSEPESVKTDTINSYVIWYATKFADVRFINGYTLQTENEIKTETYSISASLNCRF